MSGTGTFGNIGYAQRQAIQMAMERDALRIYARACGMDDAGAERALAEADRRARESLLTWQAASRQVAHEIAAGEVTW